MGLSSFSLGSPTWLTVSLSWRAFTLSGTPSLSDFETVRIPSFGPVTVSDETIEGPIPERVTVPPFDVDTGLPTISTRDSTIFRGAIFQDELDLGIEIGVFWTEVTITTPFVGWEVTVPTPPWSLRTDLTDSVIDGVVVGDVDDFDANLFWESAVELDLPTIDLPNITLPFTIDFVPGFTIGEGSLFDRRLVFDLPDFETRLLPRIGPFSFSVPTSLRFDGSVSIPDPSSLNVSGTLSEPGLQAQALDPLPTEFVSSPVKWLRDRLVDDLGVPEAFLTQPSVWALDAVLSEFTRQLESGILSRAKRVLDAVLSVALSEETKQKVRDQARD